MAILQNKQHVAHTYPKAIWITGASSGIGAALSEYYAAPGITLGLIARRTQLLEQVVTICRQKGATVYKYVADVVDAEHLRQCAEDFQAKVTFVDLVIANAGLRLEEDLEYQQVEIAEKIIKTNYLGVINTFSPFIAAMKKHRAGSLAVISSIAAFRGTPNSGAYSASKAAINVWTESLRLRLKPYSINISTLCVGFVDTEMTEKLTFWMPGILSVDKAAAMIASAIDKRKRSILFPWQSKLIWNLFRMLPGSLYDQLILWMKARHMSR